MRRLLLASMLAALMACNGTKRAECSAITDALTPLADGANKALARYDPEEMARYQKLVAETKAKIAALKLTDEKLAAYRVDLLKMLDMNLATLERLASHDTSALREPALTTAEVKEKSAVLGEIKAYCK